MSLEFLDQNGTPLEIGDEIEYWSPSNKDWLKAKVAVIEAKRQYEHVNDGAGGWKMEPVTKIKIKVQKWNSGYNQFMSYDLLNLRKSETIRKVF